jgi:hypothetical protein
MVPRGRKARASFHHNSGQDSIRSAAKDRLTEESEVKHPGQRSRLANARKTLFDHSSCLHFRLKTGAFGKGLVSAFGTSMEGF